MTVIDVWVSRDAETIDRLHAVVDGSAAPEEFADWLFTVADPSAGRVTLDALHIAAEATTDGDINAALEQWRELASTLPPRVTTCSTLTTKSAVGFLQVKVSAGFRWKSPVHA